VSTKTNRVLPQKIQFDEHIELNEELLEMEAGMKESGPKRKSEETKEGSKLQGKKKVKLF
jgi:hypothetical protein